MISLLCPALQNDQAFQTTINILLFSWLVKHRAFTKQWSFPLCFPSQSNKFKSWSKFLSTESTLNGNQSGLHWLMSEVSQMSEPTTQARSQPAVPGLQQVKKPCTHIPQFWEGYKENLHLLFNDIIIGLLFIWWLIHCGSSPLFYY